ncbi:MAG: hypothetical protein ACI9ZF_001426 [Bradyrhizobium sp.]|jgi:hypothetical protein
MVILLFSGFARLAGTAIRVTLPGPFRSRVEDLTMMECDTAQARSMRLLHHPWCCTGSRQQKTRLAMTAGTGLMEAALAEFVMRPQVET